MALDILAGIGLLAAGDRYQNRLRERRERQKLDLAASERERLRGETGTEFAALAERMGLDDAGIAILQQAGRAGEGAQVLADKLSRRSPAELRAQAAAERDAQMFPHELQGRQLANERAEFELRQAQQIAANPILDPTVRQERSDYIDNIKDGAFTADRAQSALGLLYTDNPLAAQSAIASLLLTLTGREATLRGDGMIGRMGDAQGIGDAIVNAWNKMLGQGFSAQSKLEFEQTLAGIVAPTFERLLRAHSEWERVEQLRGLPPGSITTGAGADLDWVRSYLQMIRDEGIYRPWEGGTPGDRPPPAQAEGLGLGSRLRGWLDDRLR
jgi:hypothetical protein